MPILSRPFGRPTASHNRVNLHLERLEERDAPSATPLYSTAAAIAPAHAAAAVLSEAVTPAAQGGWNGYHAPAKTTSHYHAPAKTTSHYHAPAKASTTTTLSVSAHAVQPGQRLTLTAAVDAVHASATPAGTVTFKDGSTVLGTAWLNAHGVAKLTTSLAKGSHHISTVYAGDGHVKGSVSAAAAVTVTPATSRPPQSRPPVSRPPSSPPPSSGGPQVSITDVGNVSTADMSLVFEISVRGASGGSVSILDGGRELGQLGVDRSGQAALAIGVGLSAGRHSLTVNYTSADGRVHSTGSLSLYLATNPTPMF
jgi:hypothetical protein